MVTSVMTGSRVVDPDEGSGDVSFPGELLPLETITKHIIYWVSH